VSALRCHKLRGPQSALDLVFPNAVGQPYEAGNLLKRILYPAFAALGLPKTGWRVFRRSVATALSEMREPVRTTQQVLGHSSPQTTLAFYVQSVEESQREAIGRLEEQMSPNVPKFRRLSKLVH
jgi:integrase